MAETTASALGALRATYQGPDPVGDPAALTSMGTIAAPLLAGFSVTVVTLTAQTPDAFRYAGLVFLVGAAAAISLLTCVQCTFHAQRYAATPQEVMSRFPPEVHGDVRFAALLEAYKVVQEKWSARGRRTYSAGIICFLVGLALMLAPATGKPHGTSMPVAHWGAVVLAGLAALAELVWVACARMTDATRRPTTKRPRSTYQLARREREAVLANFWKGIPPPSGCGLAERRFLLDRLLPTVSAELAKRVLELSPERAA